MKTYKIAVIKGDGIGPEIVNEAIKILKIAAQKFNFTLHLKTFDGRHCV